MINSKNSCVSCFIIFNLFFVNISYSQPINELYYKISDKVINVSPRDIMSLGNLAAEYYGGKVIHVPLVAASTTQMDIITFTYSYVTDNLHVFLIKMNKNNILKSNIKFVEKNCPPSENENKCIVNTKMILKSCTYKYVASTIDGMPGIDGTECEVDEFYFSLR